MAQAHAPEHAIPGGLPTERLIAWIIVSKFGDFLPFYRKRDGLAWPYAARLDGHA